MWKPRWELPCPALAWGPDGREGLSLEGGGPQPCLRWRLRQGRGSDRTEAQLEGSEQYPGPAHSTETLGSILHLANKAPHPQALPPSMGHPHAFLPEGSYTPSLCNGQACLGLWWEGST